MEAKPIIKNLAITKFDEPDDAYGGMGHFS